MAIEAGLHPREDLTQPRSPELIAAQLYLFDYFQLWALSNFLDTIA